MNIRLLRSSFIYLAGRWRMGRRHRRTMETGLLVALAGGAALSAAGCDWSCAGDFTCELEGPACPQDPAEGYVPEACGVWVSASLGHDVGPGTQAAPVRTLAKAMELASGKGPKRVYACGEEYMESVELPAGIALFGGFDCTS